MVACGKRNHLYTIQWLWCIFGIRFLVAFSAQLQLSWITLLAQSTQSKSGNPSRSRCNEGAKWIRHHGRHMSPSRDQGELVDYLTDQFTIHLFPLYFFVKSSNGLRWTQRSRARKTHTHHHGYVETQIMNKTMMIKVHSEKWEIILWVFLVYFFVGTILFVKMNGQQK